MKLTFQNEFTMSPVRSQSKMVKDCEKYFDKLLSQFKSDHLSKVSDIALELMALDDTSNDENFDNIRHSLKNAWDALEQMESTFDNRIEDLKSKMYEIRTPSDMCNLKKDFVRECNSFKYCLPIYAKKDEILETVRTHPVTVVVAETGSGKSTQLPQYLLQSFSGTIVCTQPRKIAVMGAATFVCEQIGCAIGEIVGYDVGVDQKFNKCTKIMYMTDYALLKMCLENSKLHDVSCVIVDEAHERTLYTDLLLGLMKQCVELRSEFRVIITSATIDPVVFVNFFKMEDSAVLQVPGKVYPVEEVWLDEDVDSGWDYVNQAAETASRIHQDEPEGDILVFLTSPNEIDEAISVFKNVCPEDQLLELLSVHGKCDLKEQMQVFQTPSKGTRRVIFATNAAETSLTIPNIRYVIDSGMAKDLVYFPARNATCLKVTFINKSSARQRKGRAGRTQPGKCYRLYSEQNYSNMKDRPTPEILKSDLLKAVLKIYEFGIQPQKFDFIDVPSSKAMEKSIKSLEHLGLVQNNKLNDFGRKVAKLPLDPRLSKLVLLGVERGIGYEAEIVAAFASTAASRLFIRFGDNIVEADKRKLEFCHKSGDFTTYLEIYKRWEGIPVDNRHEWCVENFISFKALKSVSKTIKEIQKTLEKELNIFIECRYCEDLNYDSKFEEITFSCFSENLCIYSGHPKLGYFSLNSEESLFIHPSSALSYLGVCPDYLIYNNLMETSRNFMLDMTVVKEVEKLSKVDNFNILKNLKIYPIVCGPFGESTLVRYIIGRSGSNMEKVELMIQEIAKRKHFKIDVCVERGTIIVHSERIFHETISHRIEEVLEEAHSIMSKENEVVKIRGSFSFYCLGSGATVSDIILPGEFRGITIEGKSKLNDISKSLLLMNDLNSIVSKDCSDNKFKITAIFKTVESAKKAMFCFRSHKDLKLRPHIYAEECVERTLPIFRIKVSWYRSLAAGTGCVIFFSHEDRKAVIALLSLQPLYIENNFIRFYPSNSSPLELEMKNLPSFTDEKIVGQKLNELIEESIKFDKIHVFRRRTRATATGNEVRETKEQLVQIFGRFTPSSFITVDLVHPKPNCETWNATIFFDSAIDGELAFAKLHGKLILNSVPAEMAIVIENHIFARKRVLYVVRKDIDNIVEAFRNCYFFITESEREDSADIRFQCPSLSQFYIVNKKLTELFRGQTIEPNVNKHNFEHFSVLRDEMLTNIENRTNTCIYKNNLRKSLTIFGSKQNCKTAQVEINSLTEQRKSFSNKIFNLKISHLPRNFYKHFLTRFGMLLEGLHKDYGVKAELYCNNNKLKLQGLPQEVKQVVNTLENFLSELCTTADHCDEVEDDNKEKCGICSDIIPYTFHILEHCGHAFCKSCLLLQVKANRIPLLCHKQDCRKDWYVVDIRKILALADESTKRDFYEAALQHFVSVNHKVEYCPTPNCPTVYRVTQTEKQFYCPCCKNVICTHCHSLYHYGMSCVQNNRTEEDT